jgi:hypothetical protein
MPPLAHFLGAHFQDKNLDRLDGRILPPDRAGPHLPGRHGRAALLVRGFVSKTGGRHTAHKGKFQPGGLGGSDHRTQGECLWAQSKIFISGALVFGGLGVGSDFMWDGNDQPGLSMDGDVSTTVGYRYLDVDYDEDDFCTMFIRMDSFWDFPGGFRERETCGKIQSSGNG